MSPLLKVADVSKSFGALKANSNISFEVSPGEVLAILGENGAGKTTLMNIIFGHYLADTGDVEFKGSALRAGDPRAAIEAGIGMVHQHLHWRKPDRSGKYVIGAVTMEADLIRWQPPQADSAC